MRRAGCRHSHRVVAYVMDAMTSEFSQVGKDGFLEIGHLFRRFRRNSVRNYLSSARDAICARVRKSIRTVVRPATRIPTGAKVMVTESTSHHRCVANGIKVHYAEVGEGPPVVLLHGFPETSYAWRFQIEALKVRYRLIVPDLRGYGATEKAPTGYDKRTMANDIRALMSNLGIE